MPKLLVLYYARTLNALRVLGEVEDLCRPSGAWEFLS